MTDRELLEQIAHDVSFMKTQQSEHREILQALRHSSETHGALLNNFEVEIARLAGKIEGLSTDINYLKKHTLSNVKLERGKALE